MLNDVTEFGDLNEGKNGSANSPTSEDRCVDISDHATRDRVGLPLKGSELVKSLVSYQLSMSLSGGIAHSEL